MGITRVSGNGVEGEIKFRKVEGQRLLVVEYIRGWEVMVPSLVFTLKGEGLEESISTGKLHVKDGIVHENIDPSVLEWVQEEITIIRKGMGIEDTDLF